ncbi:MAG: ACT domain-containing protein [Thermoguttaceae bacterium]|jgi:hypothetical protein
MKLAQLSLILDNKPGALIAPCELLAGAGINIVTLSLADSERIGVLRLLVAEWQKARELLEAAGYKVHVSYVLAIEVADKPGGLLDLLRLIAEAGLNVAHMYAFTERLGQSAVLVFSFDDLDAAITCLTRAGINPVTPVYLYDQLGEQ